ncbi:MAG: hypothetical protein ACD_4C00299G0004, partial [uncultured bacterium (gcode 4)]
YLTLCKIPILSQIGTYKVMHEIELNNEKIKGINIVFKNSKTKEHLANYLLKIALMLQPLRCNDYTTFLLRMKRYDFNIHGEVT